MGLSLSTLLSGKDFGHLEGICQVVDCFGRILFDYGIDGSDEERISFLESEDEMLNWSR